MSEPRETEKGMTADQTEQPVKSPWDSKSDEVWSKRRNAQRVSPKWRLWHTGSLLLIIVVIGVVGVSLSPHVGFLINMVLLAAFTTIAGHGIVGLWFGVLIDERNRISLSRLQMYLWTVLILSGLLSAILWNIFQFQELKIQIPPELWLVMGISATSLVGSPLVMNMKTAAQTSDKQSKEENRTMNELERQGMPKDAVIVQGKVVFWDWPEDARLPDLFQGDEIGNAAHLDLGKVQMFFFTLVLVSAYIVMIVYVLGNAAQERSLIISLPSLDQSIVTLLGISHAGYLTNKAVPHSVGR